MDSSSASNGAGFESVEEFARALDEIGIDGPTVKAMDLWAAPGVMYVAGPLIRELVDEIERWELKYENALEPDSRDE